jgi:phospholipid/cholesterol/gamma-HCH transport system substrate-binding protein
MDTRANYFKIGVFVIGTILILVIGIIPLTSVIKKDVLLFETYLDESVQGLNVGSAVMERGVQIGKVKKITFLTHEYEMEYGSEEFRTYSPYVMLVMEVYRDTFPPKLGGERIDEETIRMIVDQWIVRGLRLKLSYQGITGMAYIDADYVQEPEEEPKEEALRIPPWKPKYIYIPSAKSTLTTFTETVDSILQTLNNVDFTALSESLTATSESISQAILDAKVADTRDQLSELILDLQETNSLIVNMMDETKSEESGANIPRAIAQFNKTLTQMDEFILRQQSDLEEIVANMKRVSANLREMTESAKRYPRSILFGAPPAESEVIK